MRIVVFVLCFIYYVVYSTLCSVNVVFILWLAFALMLQESQGKWSSSPRLKMRIAQYNISKKETNKGGVGIKVNSTLKKRVGKWMDNGYGAEEQLVLAM